VIGQIYCSGNYVITTNKLDISPEDVHGFLSKSYWASHRTKETVELSMENSLCFGMFEQNKLIGFARVITDHCTFAYLCDVYIDEDYRGQGLGKWLVSCILEQPNLQNLRRWMLATQDAQGLYAQFGFKPLNYADRFMEIINPNSI
jgi:N-acetylglutamate synthase-like GNAT family acetyltransferase